MKAVENWLSNLGKTLKSMIASGNSGYKLTTVDMPELYKLKAAHNELLQSYVESLGAVSRLSFLVGMNEVNPPKVSLVANILRVIFWGKFSPFRVLVWRPVIKLYVSRHIYKKLQELKEIYIQSSLVSDNNYCTWFEKAKGECEEFQKTVVNRNIFLEVFRYFIVTLIGLSVAVWSATSLYDLLIKILFSQVFPQGIVVLVKFIVLTIIAFPFVLTFLNFAFTTKRAIFLNIKKTDSNSVYGLENYLFKLLNRGKSREFPVDFLVLAIFYWIIIGFLWLFHLGISQLPHASNAIVLDCTWCLLVPYIVMFFSDVIAPWWRREMVGEL